MSEQWRAIPGWEGLYEASSVGRLRSVSRVVTMRNGVARGKAGRVLTPGISRGGYPTFSLWRDGAQGQMVKAHVAVLAAFVGTRPEGAVVRHLNGNPTDNRLANLAYGTASDNQLDKVAHGRHQNANKTHCAQGHPFDEANTIRDARQRRCRTCVAARAHRRYLRQKGIGEDEQLPGIAHIVGRPVDHRDALTADEYDRVIAALESRPDAVEVAGDQ